MPGNQPAKFHKFTRTFSPSQKTIGNPFTDYFFTTPSRSLFFLPCFQPTLSVLTALY